MNHQRETSHGPDVRAGERQEGTSKNSEAEKRRDMLQARVPGQVRQLLAQARELATGTDELTQLTRELAEERERVGTLANLAMRLNAASGLAEVTKIAVAQVTQALQGDAGALLLPGADDRHLRCSSEFPASIVGDILVDVEAMPNLKRAVSKREYVFFSLEESSGEEAVWFRPGRVRGCLALPLTTGARLLGLTLVQHRRAGAAPAQEAVSFAKVVGEQCAIAIDRALAQERAETERAYFEAVLLQMPSGVVVAEAPTSRIVLLNESAKRIWPQSVPVPQTIDEYRPVHGLHSDGRPYAAEEYPLIRSLLKGEMVAEEEIGFMRPDGRLGAISTNSAPVRNREGRIVASVAVFTDITERKRTEQALRESEDRLRAMIDNASALIHLKDTEGRYILVNKAFEELLGVPREQVVGKHDFEVLPAGAAATLRANSQKVVAACGPLRFEEVLPLNDGMHTFISVKFPLFDHKGAVYGVCGISTDITERKRAEADLERLSHQLKLLLESTDEGVFGTDLSERFSFINRAAARMLGYDPAELLGKDSHATIHHSRNDGSPYPKEECPLIRTLQTGEGARVTDEILWRRDGTFFPVEYSVRPVIEDGAVKGSVVTLVDISERQRVEQLREEYVHTTSHDLRAPLTVIQGQAQLLERSLEKGGVGTPQKQTVEAIVKSARKMNAMIQDLVDAARIESGQLNVSPRPVDIHAILLDLKQRMTVVGGGGRIQVDAPDNLPMAMADPDRLERIVTNLLTNAFKYSPPDSLVFVSAERRQNELIIKVSDRGVGIPKEMLPHLFERYYRTTKAKERTEGLGLGLYITKGLVEAHRGRIWVESAPECGSTFFFTLPAAERERTV